MRRTSSLTDTSRDCRDESARTADPSRQSPPRQHDNLSSRPHSRRRRRGESVPTVISARHVRFTMRNRRQSNVRAVDRQPAPASVRVTVGSRFRGVLVRTALDRPRARRRGPFVVPTHGATLQDRCHRSTTRRPPNRFHIIERRPPPPWTSGVWESSTEADTESRRCQPARTVRPSVACLIALAGEAPKRRQPAVTAVWHRDRRRVTAGRAQVVTTVLSLLSEAASRLLCTIMKQLAIHNAYRDDC